MDNFVVSARKYRPATFDTVVGQESVTSTLKNAIRNKHLAQAYLFCGPRGVGKTTCARILAKTINCFNLSPEIEACNECESCRSFNESRSYSIHELDAASNNSVDDIRNLIDQVRIPPQVGQYSIYIIDEVHMLSSAAFNAFLKTLEEPPKHALFILATTEKHKILPTILSRCQVFDFNRIKLEDTVRHLQKIATLENIQADPDALSIIAQKADGGMRDALSVFDQVVSFTNGIISYKAVIDNLNVLDYDYYFKLTDAFLTGDVSSPLLVFDEILSDGFDAHNFILGLAKHFRDLLVSKDAATLSLLEVGENIRERYRTQSAACAPDFLYHALDITGQCDLNFKTSRNQRLLVEMTLVKLARLVLDKKKNSVTESHTTSNQQNNITSPAQVYEKPVNQNINNTPTQPPRIRTGTPSIKSALRESTQKQTEQAKSDNNIHTNLSDYPAGLAFNLENANIYLKKFTKNLEESRPRMFNTLINRTFILNENQLELTFDNQSQAEEFSTELLNQLQAVLRHGFDNSNLTISIKVEAQEGQPLIYTTEDKFRYMIEKNPALLKLKQRLGLDFE
jgi:DNA polymerase-3 subunit gamma/tau